MPTKQEIQVALEKLGRIILSLQLQEEFQEIFPIINYAIKSALDKNNGWQPIETAPKDGTVIVVLSSFSGEVTVAWVQSMGAWLTYDGTRRVSDALYWRMLLPPPKNEEE